MAPLPVTLGVPPETTRSSWSLIKIVAGLISLDAGRLRFVDREPIHPIPLVVQLVVDGPPAGSSVSHQRAEGGILGTRAGQHAQEPAATLMQVGHVLGGGQLTVGHVEEVAAPGQLAQQLPSALVRAVVGGVA